MKVLKTFEQFSLNAWKRGLPKRVEDIKNLDRKNRDIEHSNITEEDPFGEDSWSEDKSEVVKDNVYKVLLNNEKNNEKKIILKTDKDNYYIIGRITYWNIEKDFYDEEDVERWKKHFDEEPPKTYGLPYAYDRYKKEFIEGMIQKIGQPIKKYMVYFYTTRPPEKIDKNLVINKLEKLNDNEINDLMIEMNRNIDTGDLMTDLRYNVKELDKIYHKIKE